MQKGDYSSRLERIILPVASTQLEVELVGCFGCPEEWRTTDEANPNTFTYTARFMTAEFTGGKIQARLLTQKEVREQEQATKKKLPPKKQAKDPQEEEKLRKLREEEAQTQLEKQLEENKLPEEERMHRMLEDPYRALSLKFEARTTKIQLNGSTLVVFEERVKSDSGEWLYLYKYSSLSEEEINKLKKGKPKNLNLTDLNPVVMRAWIDLSSFREPNQTETQLRCRLEQVDDSPETSKPNLEKTYVLVNLKLSETISKPLDLSSHLTSSDLIRPVPPRPELPADEEALNSLSEEIKVIVESIAMEFSQASWKELNADLEQKNLSFTATTKLSDISKRREHFLYEFNIRGMYKTMKERVKKVIVKICKNRYTHTLKDYSSFTGVSFEPKDQFYSQIYTFLVDQYHRVLKQIVQEKKEDLYVTSVEAKRTALADTQKYIKQRINQSEEQRVSRLTSEYESVRDIEATEEVFREALQTKELGDGLDLKLQYVKFCLRNSIGTVGKLSGLVYQVLQGYREDREVLMLYTLLLFASKKKSESRQGWVFLRDLIDQEPQNVSYLVLASLVFEMSLDNPSLSDKYLRLAERTLLAQANSLPEKGQHHSAPSSSQLPTLKSSCSYDLELMPSERDEKMYHPLLNIFGEYNLFELVDMILPKIEGKDNPQIQYLDILSYISKKNTQKALEKTLELYTQQPSLQLCKVITRIGFESESYEMCLEYLKRMLRFREAGKDQGVYLQLATIYYLKAEYSNAKACLLKLLQLNQNNSLAWLKLGKTEAMLGNTDTAVDCLREANVLSPRNSLVWLGLCEIYLKKESMNIANSCLISYLRLRIKNEDESAVSSLVKSLKSLEYSNDNSRVVAQLMISNIQAAPS